MAPFYWERHPNGPFATLIEVATTYLDPENYDLEELVSLARREDDEEMRVFKLQLREAVKDPSKLPGNELSASEERLLGVYEELKALCREDLPPVAAANVRAALALMHQVVNGLALRYEHLSDLGV